MRYSNIIMQEVLGRISPRNCMVVDIQPQYKKVIRFDMFEFCQFLNKQKKILYLYNGPDTVGEDSKNDIIKWLLKNSFDSDKLKDITWIDKGYGFFRGWMDQGIDNSIIKKVLRYMIINRIRDSKDIENLEEVVDIGDEYEEWMFEFENEPIYLPDILISKLKKFNKGYLCGGGVYKCLKEFIILLSVFNIKYKLVEDFVFY